jgi:hypothetical protein
VPALASVSALLVRCCRCSFLSCEFNHTRIVLILLRYKEKCFQKIKHLLVSVSAWLFAGIKFMKRVDVRMDKVYLLDMYLTVKQASRISNKTMDMANNK